MSQPLVSVVMAVYNAEKYLNESIDSVLNQTYTNFELIVVNDGSTDSSKDIIFSYPDKRIKYFENLRNLGLVPTRNKLLEKAKGKYIATLDSDDVALPERLQLQVEFMENNPDYGMCGTFYKLISTKGDFLYDVVLPETDKDIKTFLHFDNCFCNSTTMINAELVKELKYVPGFNFIEDFELWHRIAKKTKFTNLPVFTTLYRIHGSNVSHLKKTQLTKHLQQLNYEILNDLDIDFSEKELNLHTNALRYNEQFFKQYAGMKELEEWMIKLCRKFEDTNEYNSLIVYRILVEKWMVICFKNKEYNRILLNRLFLQRTGVYINILYKKIFNKGIVGVPKMEAFSD
jgi:glycosyltransferase involved in cell wall biosynthesis